MSAPSSGVAALQVPPPGALTLDHLAHFVPNMSDAGIAFERLGFRLTPFSQQSHRLHPDGPLVPAGTANRCIMFERGYLEILTPTADTPLAAQLQAAIARYVGLHLIAFGTSAPEADHARLEHEGFQPLVPVALQRPISTPAGEDTARFTVVRVPPGTMPEGRIQFCHQRTPELVWQGRWLDHPNGAKALAGVVVCTADPQEAASRHARFTGLPTVGAGAAWRLDTCHGTLYFVDPDVLARRLSVVPPALPWVAAAIIEVADLDRASGLLRDGGCEVTELDANRCATKLPGAIGGMLVCEYATGGTLRFD